MKRASKLSAAVVGGSATVLLASVASLFLGVRLQSPEQAAANARPPTPSVLTADVDRRVLVREVVLRGDVAAASAADVTSPVGGDGPLIVTDLPVGVGGRVVEGAVVAVVNGRPVIALGGPIRAYRDLRPGDVGPDVTQLRTALGGLGLRTGRDPKGEFGPATQLAVARLYARLGFEAPQTAEDAAQLERSASSQVDGSADAAASASRNLEDALKPRTPAEISQAGMDVERAARQLGLATERAKAAAKAAGEAVNKAERTLDAISRDDRRALAIASAEVALADAKRNQVLVQLVQQDAVQAAKEAVALAEQEAATLPSGATSTDVLRAQLQRDKARRSLDIVLASSQDALADAATTVNEALAAVTELENDRSHEGAIADAAAALEAARQTKALTTLEGAASLADAAAALESKLAAATSVGERKDVRELEAAVRTAQRALRDAQVSAAFVMRHEGVMIPRSEIAYVSTLPAQVVTVRSHVGTAPPEDGVLLTVGAGAPTIHAVVQGPDRELLRPGMPATITDEVGGRTVKGTVRSIADEPETTTERSGFALEVSPAEMLPATAIGTSVRLTIATASTPAEVLVVPVSAVVANARGETRVEKLVGERRIPLVVTVGMSANGFVEILRPDGGRLRAGDKVVLGSALTSNPR